MGFDELVLYLYSSGDVFMCNIKLIVIYMFLMFGLSMISVVSDGIGSV